MGSADKRGKMIIGITEAGDAAIHSDLVLASIDKMGPSGVMLITKNPGMLAPVLPRIPVPFVVHCTITGFGGTTLEPNVVSHVLAMADYFRLVDKYGPDRVVLRVDPYIDPMDFPSRGRAIIDLAAGRVRISFLDGYSHVRERFASVAPEYARFLPSHFHWPIELRKRWIKDLGRNVEVCGEPGIECTGCVSAYDLHAMGLPEPKSRKKSEQRWACACLAIKKELINKRRRCMHQCLYCYWMYS